MNERGKPQERERRDWIIILIILLFGFLCVIVAGEQAVRFSPRWRLDTNMRSNLDPNSDFLTNRPDNFYEPLDPSILTQQIRINNFLTPGALFEIHTLPPALGITNTPIGTNTTPTLLTSPTAVGVTNTPTAVTPSPTNTLIYFPPPPPTNTPKPPPPPTKTPLPIADLAITKTDLNSSYVPGGTLTYTITVVNNGPSNINGAIATDTFNTSMLNNITWTCAYTGGASSACAGSGNINDSINLPNGATVVYTVLTDISGSATGNLVNTASVSLPAGYTDPDTSNNSATDTDTLATLSADLAITKTDVPASTTYTPGNTITYSIVVTNPSTSTTAVTGATVTDIFDATRLNTITWTCAYTGGASSSCAGTGNINDSANLPIGGTVTYTVTASINSGATGNLVNTATVSAPAGIYDPDTTNNSDTDIDTSAPSANLQIVKTSSTTTYSAGSIQVYTITVSNAGPSAVTGATVTDIFSTNTNILNASWLCVPTGGASCTLIGTGNISDTVNLPVGSFISYNVLVTVVSNPTGDLINTATVTAPLGVTDPDLSNNSSTYTHTTDVDVQVTKDDSSATYTSGGSTTYTVTVTNNSTFNLTGVAVSDNIPSLITDWDWACTSQNGGASGCDAAPSNSSDFTDTVDLPANGSNIVYTVTANIHQYAAGDLVNTATVTVPPGYVDAIPGNNSATDTDTNQAGEPSIGPPNGGLYPIGEGGSATFYLSKPIVANGDAAADFVYYEELVGTNIYLDNVIIDISMDGITWYRVFYWGNATPDTNTNVNNSIPPINGVCVTEVDNCTISYTYLYNGNTSGITVDVDNSPFGSVSSGNYYWIRFTEPGGSGDGIRFDSIELITP